MHQRFSLRFRQRRKRFAFCLIVRGSVRYPVREALALDALEGFCRTFPVCGLASVPLEIPFREIAMQMSFADRMVGAIYSPLHEAMAALGRVGVREPAHAHVFVC